MNLILAQELGCLKAAAEMFLLIFGGILRAPCEFFETIPRGRIIDRCSRDLYTLDLVMTPNIRVFMMTMSRVGLSFVTMFDVLTDFVTRFLITGSIS